MILSVKVKGLVMVMVSAILYGFMPLLARFSYNEGLNVVSVLFYRYLFAFLMLAVFVIVRKINLKISLRQFGIILMAAIVGTVLTTYSLFLSYDYISIGLASTLHFIYPAVTCFLAIIIYKESFSRNKLLALICSLIGIVFLTLNKDVQLNVNGILWALISGVFYAIYIICAANKELRKLSPYTVAFYVFGITCILFFFWGARTSSISYDLSYKAILYLGNLSFLSTFIAVILFFVGMQGIGPSNAAILSTFEPITGVVLGLMIFNEHLNIHMLLGSILVIISVFLISKDRTVSS